LSEDSWSPQLNAGALGGDPALVYIPAEEGPMTYKIALRRTEEGFSVWVPGLPGCWSEGATEAEAIENIRDAIREYLAARDELLREADVREIEVAV
jgi:predicted RNase H-like HicB family nuclease